MSPNTLEGFHNKNIGKVSLPKFLVYVTSRNDAEKILKNGLKSKGSVIVTKDGSTKTKGNVVTLTAEPGEVLKYETHRDAVGVMIDPRGLKLKYDARYYPDWINKKQYDGKTLSDEINRDETGIYMIPKTIPKRNIKGIMDKDIYKIGAIH
jgi:hypothetical protein